MEERRVAWRKAIHGTFSEEEMAESTRRVTIGIGLLEEHLSKHAWLGSDNYSLADINAFNLAYALPLTLPELMNDEKTPFTMEWLRKINERPATRTTWDMGTNDILKRIPILERGAK